MPSGTASLTSPSIVSVSASTCRLRLSLGTPGRSARSVIPVLSSITSTGGITAVSLRCADSLRAAASVRDPCSFLVTAFASFMVSPPDSLDGDPAGWGGCAALRTDAQNAIAVVSGDAIGIDVVRQTHHAPEPAAETLVDVY